MFTNTIRAEDKYDFGLEPPPSIEDFLQYAVEKLRA